MDMTKLSNGWKVLSLLSCVSTCLRNYSSCLSVKFNKSSNHCTPGSWVFQTNTRQDEDLHLLYSPEALCGNTADTVMKEFNGVHTCLFTSRTQFTYESSSSQCQVKGAKLYTIKVPEKLKILEKTFTTNYDSYWVGLINFGQGVLRWVDGGPMLTTTDLESLFRQGDLLVYSTHTRCDVYITGLSKLGFAECNQLMKFLCEK
ncbi:unnamed protein product [Lymnaea stagnalis]|uniref:C-type lectin domain-containing protein n=1 Tax=Lymnaea stagnalis TaxID=6523 RepID=A0AAV2GX30_LYMST